MAKRKAPTKKKPAPKSASKSAASSSAGSSKRRKTAKEKLNTDEDGYQAIEDCDFLDAELEELVDEMDPANAGDSPADEDGSDDDAGNPRKSVRDEELECKFLGDPISEDEARRRWPLRYDQSLKNKGNAVKGSKSSDEDDEIILAKRHYLKAEVDGKAVYELYDNAHVKAPKNEKPYICKIIELFEGEDGIAYFTAQWYYRSTDTVIEDCLTLKEKQRVFLSEMKNHNPLDCLVEKVTIIRVPPNMDLDSKLSAIPKCDYYYDLLYLLPYTTFVVPPPESSGDGSDSQSTISSEVDAAQDTRSGCDEVNQANTSKGPEMSLLDLYSGCGGMSTGLCHGANLGQINLVTRWAVDLNRFACKSLRLNHPETNVRHESVEVFLKLLKEWRKLCATFGLIDSNDTHEVVDAMDPEDDDAADEEGSCMEDTEEDGEVFEVEKIIKICLGQPNNDKKVGLYFKVRWKGYDSSEDTWEPVNGLGHCRKSIGEFVKEGFRNKILPLPGDVDVLCGGPPCQGVSGFNRFRNKANPLADIKNKQLEVFMDVVDYLEPRFVLMENVVDLLKFAHGFLGRYAVGRLVNRNYQARMGLMAAGAYGLPQFRMRVFVWGAKPSETLPQYPLPTHDVVSRGVVPTEFVKNLVAYDEGHSVNLKDKLFLGDAISDLPEIQNDEQRDELEYTCPPTTDFQRFIRLTRDAMFGYSACPDVLKTLYDHRPLKLNADDYERVCRVPKRKGANFRDFPGVRVRPDNKVEFVPSVKRELLKSGKFLVPDYAMSFVNGSSSKPFARLWWDETVPTVVTRAEPHNQAVCHPVQDRVLSVRENARLQGFPDYYQLKGTVKERYIQIGNAVAVPVGRALGYSLAASCRKLASREPLMTLPPSFPNLEQSAASPSTS